MPDAFLQRKLYNWQMLLLDLTRANRLLYFKTERGSSVPITSPAAAELFQLLVAQAQQLKFPAADERALFEEEAEEDSSSVSSSPTEVIVPTTTANEANGVPATTNTSTSHPLPDQPTSDAAAPAEVIACPPRR